MDREGVCKSVKSVHLSCCYTHVSPNGIWRLFCLQVVSEALDDGGIQAVEVRGSVHTKTKALDSMQEAGGPRVILLNLADESASGANLTLCNHAIFVHPMLADSQQQYTACETQAIGKTRVKTIFSS